MRAVQGARALASDGPEFKFWLHHHQEDDLEDSISPSSSTPSLPGVLSFSQINKSLKERERGQPGWLSGLALPLAWGMILGTRDRVPRRAPSMESASPSACVSASLSLSVTIINK